MNIYVETSRSNELYHHGIKGMKWGKRRYQNKDGSLTPAGIKRYARKGFIEDSYNSNKTIAGKVYDKATNAHKYGGGILYNLASDKERKARAEKYVADKNSKSSKGNKSSTASTVSKSKKSEGKNTLAKSINIAKNVKAGEAFIAANRALFGANVGKVVGATVGSAVGDLVGARNTTFISNKGNSYNMQGVLTKTGATIGSAYGAYRSSKPVMDYLNDKYGI